MDNRQGQQPAKQPGQFTWHSTGNPQQQGRPVPQQSPYGQQPAGQSQWGYRSPAQSPFQQPYHQPSRRPSPRPPKRPPRGQLWLILGVLCVLLLASIAAIMIALRSSNVTTNNTQPKGTSTPAQQITGTSVATSTPAQQVTVTSTPAPARKATGTPTQQTITIVSDQTNVVDDIWTVTLNSVQRSSGLGSRTPRSGDIFLIVDVSLKNTSTSSQATSSHDAFALQNSSTGQAYNEVTGVGGTPDGTVAAGGTIRGKIAYEIPQSVHSFTLQCTPDLTSDASAQWHISI